MRELASVSVRTCFPLQPLVANSSFVPLWIFDKASHLKNLKNIDKMDLKTADRVEQGYWTNKRKSPHDEVDRVKLQRTLKHSLFVSYATTPTNTVFISHAVTAETTQYLRDVSGEKPRSSI